MDNKFAIAKILIFYILNLYIDNQEVINNC